jgi:hypothetical protein
MAEVEGERRGARQPGKLVRVGHEPHRHPVGVDQRHRPPAQGVRQVLDLCTGGLGQPGHVARVGRPEGRADEP